MRFSRFALCITFFLFMATWPLCHAVQPEENQRICWFIPPANWECVQPPPSSLVQVGFLGKGASAIRPSMNLAIEQVDVSLKDYLRAVREIHESELNVQWRDLGPFSFRAGKGRLTEIVSSSPQGTVKMLQGILIANGYAYILTAAASDEEFTEKRGSFLSALRSLTITPDLFSSVSDDSRRHALQDAFERLTQPLSSETRDDEWEHFHKLILEDYNDLGSYWIFLVLQKGHRQLYPE